jgi:hypothetical protein
VCVDVGKRAGSCRAPRRPARLVAARGGVRSCAPRLGASGLDSRGFSSPVASFGASGGFGRLGGGALALSWLLPGTSGLLERATSASTTTSTVPVSVNGLVKRRIAVDSIWETWGQGGFISREQSRANFCHLGKYSSDKTFSGEIETARKLRGHENNVSIVEHRIALRQNTQHTRPRVQEKNFISMHDQDAERRLVRWWRRGAPVQWCGRAGLR